MADTPLINILCSRLPRELSNQLYNEFDSRQKEAKYLIDHSNYYQSLKKHRKLVDILLALSIFHKRVISNLLAARQFQVGVFRHSEATAISIGGYTLDAKEGRVLEAITREFWDILVHFRITVFVFEYQETKEFLRQVIRLNNNTNNNAQRNQEDRTPGFDPDDLSF